ncbi:MAG: class I SAM-dependent methyltransferase [Rickettsiales bacterium]|nr:class I SAM-dependent methyltransferase [Rickettsiales bacterium]
MDGAPDASVRELVEQYNFTPCEIAPTAPYMMLSGNQLSFHQDAADAKGFSIDFQSSAFQKRLASISRQSDLAKALGLERNLRPFILDASAGLGRDAAALAQLDCRVRMAERHPIIAALLDNALKRLPEGHPLQSRLSLYYGTASDYLRQSDDSTLPDIIYFDPMFPEKTKSALVKKEMQLFQSLVGNDDDAGDQFLRLYEKALYRLVVKRPRLAPPVCEAPPPHHSITGKTVRYDVYIRARMPDELGRK